MFINTRIGFFSQLPWAGGWQIFSVAIDRGNFTGIAIKLVATPNCERAKWRTYSLLTLINLYSDTGIYRHSGSQQDLNYSVIRKYLIGVQDPIGVKQPLHLFHKCHGACWFGIVDVVSLFEPQAMLSTYAASHLRCPFIQGWLDFV